MRASGANAVSRLVGLLADPPSGSVFRPASQQDARLRSHRKHASVLVMCATIVGQAVVPRLGGKGHCTGRRTTSRRHWRNGTTRVCRSGWRSPLLTGGASPVRIFLLPRVPRATLGKDQL